MRKSNKLHSVRKELRNDQRYMDMIFEVMAEANRNAEMSNDLDDIMNWRNHYLVFERKYLMANKRCIIDNYAIQYLKANRRH